MSQAPVRAEDHAQHGASYSQGYKILHDQVDSGVSWSGNERNVAFLNLGNSTGENTAPRFADASSAFGFDFADDARGISTIDWDFDGDLDLFVSNRTAPRLRFLRNNSDRRGQFLVLKLIGTAGNRDAIGARAEVTLRDDDSEVKLLRTVYAGNGFVSQSSKWLHFGLDPGATLKDVVIRWPRGEREVFTALASNGHFLLEEGRGKAVPYRAPATVTLAAGAELKQEVSDQGTIPLARPFPLPPIAYLTMDGQSSALAMPLAGPVLLNLWSETCPPCLVELKEFAAEADRIQEAGLRILALNPDAITDSSGEAAKSAANYLRKTAFPFEAGMLNARSMEILHLAHNNVFLRPDDLPAPTSFLLDGDGRVAVVYRGRVSVDDLLRDLADMTASDPAVWQKRCWPFQGRWIGEPDRIYFMEIAIALIEKEYLEEAGDFLLSHHQALAVEHDLPETMMLCGTRLLQANNVPRAISVLQAALDLKPDLAEAHNNLGMAFRRSSRDDEARPHLEKAVKLKPSYHDARLNLATLYAAGGQFATALDEVELVLKSKADHRTALFLAGNINLKLQLWNAAKSAFEKLLEVQPNHLEALINLGGIHVQLRQYDEATRYYESALRINPKLESVRRSLSDLRNLKK